MEKCYLITGAGGSLGNTFVCVLCKNNPDEVKKLKLFDLQFDDDIKKEQEQKCKAAGIAVEWIIGNIVNKQTVNSTVEGADVVIHMAALIDFKNTIPEATLWNVNYQGTVNLLEACRRWNVSYFVYTSTSEAVGPNAYMDPLHNGDEDTEYRFKPVFTYSKIKRKAEDAVLAANNTLLANKEKLITCALRPPGIYGGKNNPIIKSVIKSIGKKKVLGNPAPPTALHERAYVGNLAWAHVVAAHVIQKKNNLGGNAYFIGDGTPKMCFQKLNHLILEPYGYSLSQFVVPIWLLYFIICIEFLVGKISALFGKAKQPLLTFKTIKILRTAFTTSHRKFKKDFGYEPLFSWEESLRLASEDAKSLVDKAIRGQAATNS